MKDLILFLKKINVLLIFLVLEGISLYFFFSKDTYMLSRYLLVGKEITIASDRVASYFDSYISLNLKNEALAEFNAKLIAENMELRKQISDSAFTVSNIDLPVVCVAKVLKNELRYENNFIIVDKGEKDGIHSGMSVMDEKGVVGFVSNTSDSFSVIVSIFNKDGFLTSAKLSGTSSAGSLSWNGKDLGVLQLTEMPSHTDIHVGDTVLTTSYSNIFLENMPIGRVTDFKISDGMFYSADIEVFSDMQRLDHVYLLEMKGKQERDSLETVAKSAGGIEQ